MDLFIIKAILIRSFRFSMLSGEFLDNLSDVVKQIRRDTRAFGGVQLILCGDFLQLPPIARNKNDIIEMISHGHMDLQDLHCNKGFAFQSKVWGEANFTCITLDQVFRQRSGFDFTSLQVVVVVCNRTQSCFFSSY